MHEFQDGCQHDCKNTMIGDKLHIEVNIIDIKTCLYCQNELNEPCMSVYLCTEIYCATRCSAVQ